MIQYDRDVSKLFIGSCKDTQKHGLGVSLVIGGANRGHIYEGQFSEGLYHGQGKYTWPNDDYYQG